MEDGYIRSLIASAVRLLPMKISEYRYSTRRKMSLTCTRVAVQVDDQAHALTFHEVVDRGSRRAMRFNECSKDGLLLGWNDEVLVGLGIPLERLDEVQREFHCRRLASADI